MSLRLFLFGAPRLELNGAPRLRRSKALALPAKRQQREALRGVLKRQL